MRLSPGSHHTHLMKALMFLCRFIRTLNIVRSDVDLDIMVE